MSNEYVQSAEAGMPVAREIQVAVGTERWEHLVAGGVDRLAQVLQPHKPVTVHLNAPDVVASQSAGHITDKVQPHPIGRDGRMGEG